MFTIEMLPARQGDALWIEYGDPDAPRRILIDAGTEATFKAAVKPRIERLDREDRKFELLVVSHIDADHIGGSLPLLEDKSLGVSFADVWFNGLKHLPKGDIEPFGPAQGDSLTALIKDGPWNEAWDGAAVVVPNQGTPPHKSLPGGMKLTLLSPFATQLARLRREWPETVKAHGLVEGVPATARPELGPGDIEAFGREVPPEPGDITDIAKLAARHFDEDPAPPNGTSIVLLAEFDKRKVLLNADAHPSVVRAGIENLLGDPAKKLKLDAFKLPHHGSRYNLDMALLERVECRRHLISTDGTNTSHPHIEAIARALEASPRPGGEKPELVFNYRSKWNRAWDDDAVVKRFGYERTFPPEGGPDGVVFDVMA